MQHQIPSCCAAWDHDDTKQHPKPDQTWHCLQLGPCSKRRKDFFFFVAVVCTLLLSAIHSPASGLPIIGLKKSTET